MTKLSERAKKLKDLLVMMESEPQKFAQEDLCDPRILSKLLPEGCEPAIANDPSPRKRTRTTLRLKVLDFIAKDILKWNQNAILGSLFFWEMHLNRPEGGHYREISLEEVVDFWCDPGSLFDFMGGPVKQFLEGKENKEFLRSFQEINTPGKGISLLLNCILPNSEQSRENQVRGLRNFFNKTADRLALEKEKASLEIHEASDVAMLLADHPKSVLVVPDVMDHLRELMLRKCKCLSPDCADEITDRPSIYRTIESDSEIYRPEGIDAVDRFRNASGVLVSLPHTGKTTYVKMLVLKSAEAGTDCIAVYINAVELKTYAQLKRSVYEYIVDQLMQEGLVGIEDYGVEVTALQNAERNGKFIFFIDDLEALCPEEERAIVLQFSLCKQVFFVTTPWAAASIKRLMAEYNPNREIKAYSLQKLTPAERDELIISLGQQIAGFQEAANEFLAHTYSNLFDQPIGLLALAAEFLRTGGYPNELFIAQRIMSTLLVQAGLDSYEINLNTISSTNYRFAPLGTVLAYRKPASFINYVVRIGDDPELFWPVSTLDQVFGSDTNGRDVFVRSFLEADPNAPNRVRFFVRDFHYLLLAIHYVLPDVRCGKFFGALFTESYYCVPPERRSPDLDPTSIVRQYQVDLLSYLMRPEVKVMFGA